MDRGVMMAERQYKPRSDRKRRDTSLFDQPQHQDATVLVLSSNFNIGPLLARGVLLPDVVEGEVLLEGSALRLLTATNRLDESAVAGLVSAARNVIPIAVELRPG